MEKGVLIFRFHRHDKRLVVVSPYPTEHPLTLNPPAPIRVPLAKFAFIDLDNKTGAADLLHRIINGVIYEDFATKRIPFDNGLRKLTTHSLNEPLARSWEVLVPRGKQRIQHSPMAKSRYSLRDYLVGLISVICTC